LLIPMACLAGRSARSQVSRFMNKFRRKLCLVDYGGNSGLTGHSRLLGVVLHD
jgi:ApbE superfamily uncharacterized protein (UPF0280 family)